MELSQKPSRKSFDPTSSMTNPLIRKLTRINETSEDHITYAGVAKKCLFFMLMNIMGIALALILNRIDPIVIADSEGTINISTAGAIGMVISGIFFILTPFLAFIIKRTIPVTGALYCISTGFLFTMIADMLEEYRGIVLLAMAITLAIVAVMAALYQHGVRPGQKTRTIIKTFFITSIVTSILMLICYFVPGLRDAVIFIQNDPLLSIGGGILYIIIAAIMLLVDFDKIQTAVEKKLPVKYEWVGAFGLAFSVIWLFMKVFSLISNIKGNRS